MKLKLITATVGLFMQALLFAQQGVAINTDASAPAASAVLDVKSTDKGVLVPRMTTAQRTAIANVVKGLLVFDNSTSSFWFYNGGTWVELSTGDNRWTSLSSNNISNTNTGNVGIGTIIPSEKLHVAGSIRSTGDLKLSGDAGVGVSNPEQRLHVRSSTASQGILMEGDNPILQLRQTNAPSAGYTDKGFVQLSGDNLRIGTNSSNTDGKVVIRAGGGDRVYVDGTGNVGIGVATPLVKLHVANGSIYADGMIQAVGDFNSSGNIYFDGSLRRFGTTGSANLAPYAYGVINANGTIRTSIGNFSVVLGATGEYTITCANVGPDYCVVVTAMNSGDYGNATWRIIDNHSFKINTGGWDPGIDDSTPFDCPFSFVVYKK
jgi:hypothetical protein